MMWWCHVICDVTWCLRAMSHDLWCDMMASAMSRPFTRCGAIQEFFRIFNDYESFTLLFWSLEHELRCKSYKRSKWKSYFALRVRLEHVAPPYYFLLTCFGGCMKFCMWSYCGHFQLHIHKVTIGSTQESSRPVSKFKFHNCSLEHAKLYQSLQQTLFKHLHR